jgi:hypothetical protein
MLNYIDMFGGGSTTDWTSALGSGRGQDLPTLSAPSTSFGNSTLLSTGTKLDSNLTVGAIKPSSGPGFDWGGALGKATGMAGSIAQGFQGIQQAQTLGTSRQRAGATADSTVSSISSGLNALGPWGMVAGTALKLINIGGGALMKNNKTSKMAKDFQVNDDVANSSSYAGITDNANDTKADGQAYVKGGLFGKLFGGSGLKDAFSLSNQQQKATAGVIDQSKQAIAGAAASQDMISNRVNNNLYNSSMWNNGSIQYGQQGGVLLAPRSSTRVNLATVKPVSFGDGETRATLQEIARSYPGVANKLAEFRASTGYPAIRTYPYAGGSMMDKVIDKSHYSPLTNTISIRKAVTDPGSEMMSLHVGEELAHAKQFNDSFLGTTTKWLMHDLPDYVMHKNPYTDPNSVEYDAHSRIQPKIDDPEETYNYPGDKSVNAIISRFNTGSNKNVAHKQHGGKLGIPNPMAQIPHASPGLSPQPQVAGGVSSLGVQPIRQRIENKGDKHIDFNQQVEATKQAKDAAAVPQPTAAINVSPDIMALVSQALNSSSPVPADQLPSMKNGGVLAFREGGPINVIVDGALHAHKHELKEHPDLEEASITGKGIPVITKSDGGEIEQHAEVERDELIIHYDLTKKLEELMDKGDEESMIEAGKLLSYELVKNTKDSKSKIIKNS